jgi:hypothetical protein
MFLEKDEVPEYIPGDWIKFQLTFTHKVNLESISAYFVYVEDHEQTNLPEIQMKVANTETSYKEDGGMETTVDFLSEREVPSNVEPGGEYVLRAVSVETYAGRVMNLANIPDIRCRVTPEEPPEEPQFCSFEWDL